MVQRRRIKPAPQPQLEDDEILEFEEAAPVKVAERPVMRSTRTDTRDAGREPVHVKARTRRRKTTVSEDIFYIPVEEIPEGSSYEWKRHSVNGMEDPFYIAQLREQGWEPVDPKRHPSWVPPGYTQPYIIKGGQLLMERPIELTKEARTENRQLAKRQIVEAEQRLGMTPKDTLTRQHPDIAPRVSKEIGRMVPTVIES